MAGKCRSLIVLGSLMLPLLLLSFAVVPNVGLLLFFPSVLGSVLLSFCCCYLMVGVLWVLSFRCYLFVIIAGSNRW